MDKSKNLYGHLFALTANVMWGLMSPIGKSALQEFSPISTCRTLRLTAAIFTAPQFCRDSRHSLALRPRNAKFHAKIKQQRWYRCQNQAQKAQKPISSCSFSTQRASSPQSTTFKLTGLAHGHCMTKIHIPSKNFSTTANTMTATALIGK